MRDESADLHLVMYDFWGFNAEICDVPSNTEDVCKHLPEETLDFDKENASQCSYSAENWEESASLNFNLNEFESKSS